MSLQQIVVCLSWLILSVAAESQEIAQWRGPMRSGVYPEYHLLKSWPETGPLPLWEAADLGAGYGSPTVTDDGIYITGRRDSSELLTVLTHDGELRWQVQYGKSGHWPYADARCTPTVFGHDIYLISGQGDVVCVDMRSGDVKWRVPSYKKFEGIAGHWGIAENPLLVDDCVIYTPGGFKTTVVALNRFTGETVWQSRSLSDSTAFVSPILIRSGLNRIIVTVTQHYIVGFQAETGQLLWAEKYSEIDPPDFHAMAPRNNCNTPLFDGDRLYVTSGYDHVGVQLRLLRNGTRVKRVWTDSTLDCHHGQVVKVGDFIYGCNWLDNRHGRWCCIDWHTGVPRYEQHWKGKGSIIAADGMLYCYEEKNGHMALVKATPEGFKIQGTMKIVKGKGPHWAQPVIHRGVLFVRHGEWIGAYDLRETQ